MKKISTRIFLKLSVMFFTGIMIGGLVLIFYTFLKLSALSVLGN
jgi:hypothetical protein